MTDPKSLTSVAEFHKTFQHPILETPQIPSETRCKLRVSLIAEELKELEELRSAHSRCGIARMGAHTI